MLFGNADAAASYIMVSNNPNANYPLEGRKSSVVKISNKPKKLKGIIWSMITGLLAFILAILLYLFSPYEILIQLKTRLREGNEAFEMWKEPPVDVYLKVYIFNITNKDKFLAGLEPLAFEEVGPYVYREALKHDNTSFNLDNGTVYAVPKMPLIWVPELSVGSEEDVFVLPNVALLSFANVISDASILTRAAVNVLITRTNSQPIVEQTAKEFMFGYKSTLVTLGYNFLPSWIVFDKLGLVDRMYDVEGDSFTTYTDGEMSGAIDNYNGLPYLPQWSAPCNFLQNASDGTKYPSGEDKQLYFFRKSLCRAMPLQRTNSEYVDVNGIPTVPYTFADDSLDNGHTNANNSCFCKKSPCLPAGLLDATSCYYGFPIAISYPHFYKSNESLVNSVIGMNPSREKHESYFYINSVMGTPAKVSVKLQTNIALKDLSRISNSKAFSNLVVPLLWTDNTMPVLESSIILKLVLLLRVLPILETTLFYILIFGGIALVALSICALKFIEDGSIGEIFKKMFSTDRVKMKKINC